MDSDSFINVQEDHSLTHIPISWNAFTIFFVTLTVCALLYFIFASISRKETVNGILTSTRGEINLIAPKAGILTAVYVKEGAQVILGQPLVEISTEQESKNDSLNAQIIKTIDLQIQDLQTQLVAFDRSTPIELEKLKAHIDVEHTQLRLLEAALPIQIQKMNAAKTTVETGERLSSQGAISQLQLQSFQFTYLDAAQANNDAKLKISQLSDTIASDEISLVNFPNSQAQARASIIENIELLRQKYTAAVGDDGYILKANVSGRISSMQAKFGQAVDPTQPLLTIVPRGSALYAQVYIPSRAIGFIKVGQKVRIMYDAFPYQKFGAAEGVVGQISSTVLKPNQIDSAARITEPAYPVEIILAQSAINAFGIKTPLVPGMALTADIILEKQTFLQLFLDPILAAHGRM